MTTQEQITQKESRLVELETIMTKSDAHAAKCTKLGLAFSEKYPDDYAEYCSAREEYNTVKAQLEELYERREQEEVAQTESHETVEANEE